MLTSTALAIVAVRNSYSLFNIELVKSCINAVLSYSSVPEKCFDTSSIPQ
jgi:hypothetical protein